MTLCAGGVDGELETADLIGVYRPEHGEEQLADLGLEVVRQPIVDGLTLSGLVHDSYRDAHVKLAVALLVDDCHFGQFAKVREQLYNRLNFQFRILARKKANSILCYQTQRY